MQEIIKDFHIKTNNIYTIKKDSNLDTAMIHRGVITINPTLNGDFLRFCLFHEHYHNIYQNMNLINKNDLIKRNMRESDIILISDLFLLTMQVLSLVLVLSQFIGTISGILFSLISVLMYTSSYLYIRKYYTKIISSHIEEFYCDHYSFQQSDMKPDDIFKNKAFKLTETHPSPFMRIAFLKDKQIPTFNINSKLFFKFVKKEIKIQFSLIIIKIQNMINLTTSSSYVQIENVQSIFIINSQKND